MKDTLIIIDLEATCSDDGSVPRNEMEIIEIGAVSVDASNGNPIDEFCAFVRPVRHPELTDFCTELTSITQADVDAASGFAEVMQDLGDWLAGHKPFVFASWGDYDRNQFLQDCRFHQVSYPFGEAHRNLKKEFSAAIGSKKRFGLAGAIRHLGLTFEGTHHRGIDDARNIAQVYTKAIISKRDQ